MIVLPENEPEMQEDCREEREEAYAQTEGTDPPPKKSGGFAAGFLAGILAAFTCVCVFGFGWLAAHRGLLQGQNAREENAAAGAQILTDNDTLYKLDEVQSVIEQHYLGEADSEELSTCLFKGIAAGLGDDYADYYSAPELQSMLDTTRGAYRGIGATLAEDVRTGEICALEVYDGCPAQEAGLQAGDILSAVNDVSLDGKDLTETVALIREEQGSFFLTVYRPKTQEELRLAMECREVELNYVEYRMLDDGVGYLRLKEFTERAVDQFHKALLALDAQGMKRLMVDLRNNPGGLLDSVCDILDEILPEGLIVYMEDKNGRREEHFADDSRTVECEVAVLVNGDSASASEIFAGAVQDLKLGPVIGEKTYGKGLVQETYMLSDGSAFKMTTQKYYTPLGQDIQGSGITPDYVIEDAQSEDGESKADDAVLERALALWQSE